MVVLRGNSYAGQASGKNPGKNRKFESCVGSGAGFLGNDPDLAVVITAWPSLPPMILSAIVALIGARKRS